MTITEQQHGTHWSSGRTHLGTEVPDPHLSGLTNERGEFRYEDGERIAFLLGGNAIGNVTAGPRLHLAQIVARDNGTDIPPEAHQIIGDRRVNFRHDADYSATAMADKVLQFTEDPVVGQLLEDLDGAGIFATPRGLCTAANARNELRRNAMGILRFRDVKIQLQNGRHVFADVFRPAEPGTYPVIVSCGPYGKAFNHHSIDGDADLEKHEQMEEEYFFGNDGVAHGMHHGYDPTYHTGATNSLHTGPDHIGYVQLPIVPER